MSRTRSSRGSVKKPGCCLPPKGLRGLIRRRPELAHVRTGVQTVPDNLNPQQLRPLLPTISHLLCDKHWTSISTGTLSTGSAYVRMTPHRTRPPSGDTTCHTITIGGVNASAVHLNFTHKHRAMAPPNTSPVETGCMHNPCRNSSVSGENNPKLSLFNTSRNFIRFLIPFHKS